MKVLDPQVALLTTGEVNEFFKANEARLPDKKIGAYKSVNVHNYLQVRKDLELYMQENLPHILHQPPSEKWMKNLVRELKNHNLTKTEIFTLMNLGVGIRPPPVPAADEEDKPENEVNGDDNQIKVESGVDVEVKQEDSNEEDAQNTLDQMLFERVVEEADDRFSGDEGNEQIVEILRMIKKTITSTGEDHREATMTNGS